MRIVVITMLVLIAASLGSALYYLYRDRSGSTRTAKALALRVGFSIALFVMLMAAYYFGLIGQRL